MADFRSAEPVYLVELEVEFGGFNRGDFDCVNFVLFGFSFDAGAFCFDDFLCGLAVIY